MENFNKQFQRVVREVEELGYIVETNENVKEYLIESAGWDEDYRAECNIADLLVSFFSN